MSVKIFTKKITSWESLPVLLDIETVCCLLQCSENTAIKLCINYFIEKDDTGESVNAQNFTNNEHKKKVERIKVNSQTATGGWW